MQELTLCRAAICIDVARWSVESRSQLTFRELHPLQHEWPPEAVCRFPIAVIGYPGHDESETNKKSIVFWTSFLTVVQNWSILVSDVRLSSRIWYPTSEPLEPTEPFLSPISCETLCAMEIADIRLGYDTSSVTIHLCVTLINTIVLTCVQMILPHFAEDVRMSSARYWGTWVLLPLCMSKSQLTDLSTLLVALSTYHPVSPETMTIWLCSTKLKISSRKEKIGNVDRFSCTQESVIFIGRSSIRVLSSIPSFFCTALTWSVDDIQMPK